MRVINKVLFKHIINVFLKKLIIITLFFIAQLLTVAGPQEAQAAGTSIWKLSSANNNTAIGYGDNVGRSVSTFGETGTIFPSSTSWAGANYLYVYANNWADGAGTKGFKIEVKTTNFTNITVSYSQTSDNYNSTNIGPRDFKLQYSLNDVDYVDVPNGSVILGNGWGEVVTKTDLQLPETCDNADAVYLRWIMTSNDGVYGQAITSSGEAKLANIDIKGIAMPVAPSDITLSNNILFPNSSSGTVVGTFSVTDFNEGDTHTLSLVEGEGSTDNSSFQIVGNELRVAEVLGQGTYSIRVNANDGTYDFAKVFSIIVDIVYPEINGGDQTWDYITNVSFNTIDNDSGAEGGGYGDYTGITTSVTRGQSYNLIVMNPPTGVIDPAYPEYIKAWIDWNHDGDFNDDGESYEVSSNLTTQQNSQTSITASLDAAIGTTRMRIVIWADEATFPPNSGSFSYGEAEDYSIDIVDSHAATPSIDTQPADYSVYVGETAELSVVASGGVALTYQWYSNTTNSSSGGTPIVDATSATYSAPTTTLGTTYYYCVVTNTDNSATGNKTATATSRVAEVIVNAPPNIAPTITDTSPLLGSTVEDTVTGSILISSFLGVSDPDPDALAGIAVYAVTGNGTWQYSLDETNWFAVGTVSETDALLLRSNDHIRYEPDYNNGETATITFRAWDQTSGVHGNKEDTSTNGGITAFSTNNGTATLTVDSVNDLPVTSNNTVTMDEDTAYAFTAADFNFVDVDTGDSLQTVRIDTLPGAGSLTLNSNAVSAGEEIGVANINSGDLEFTPAADANGAGYAGFTFSVNDSSAWSSSGATMTINVTAVNDAPVITVNQELTLNGGDTATIGNDYLSVSDADNTPEQLTYTINTAPGSGTLYKDSSTIPAGGVFTQADIDNDLITYAHDNSETTVDSFTFTVSDGVGGTITGTFNTSIEPTVINDGASGMTVTPGTVPADGSSTATITVVIKNINGNPLAGHTITLDQGSGNSVISPATCVTNAEGEAVFTVKSIRAENVTYTAYDETDNNYISQTVQVAFEPGITVSPTSGSAVEGQSMQYQVALVSKPMADVIISANHGGQLTVDGGSITFTEANYNVYQMITITALDDDFAEGPHSATVSHSVYSSDPCYNGFNIPDVTVDITDNDTPGIAIIQSDGLNQVVEGGAGDDYTIALTTQPTANVEISIDGDSQLSIDPANLVFTIADWNVPRAVNVWAIDDDDLEGNHTGTVAHSVYSTDPDYNNYNITDITVQITDNDASGNAYLSGLTISSGTLTPAFDPEKTFYTVNVSNSVSSVTVTATPEDDTATIKVNSQPVFGSQSSPIALDVGDNTITVLVTAQDNSTAKEYIITVRRAASSGNGDGGDSGDSGDSDSDGDKDNTGTEPTDGTNESIDSESGSTVSHQKVIVDIPPDTLPSDAVVSITTLTTSQVNDAVPAGLRVKMASDVYEIMTSGERQFGDNTITIKIAYDPAKAVEGEYPAIHYYDETLGRWVKLKTEHVQENGIWYAVTRVNHLTKFTVFVMPAETAAEKQLITLTIGQIQASVNGSAYILDAVPYVDKKAQRTLVPVRFVSEALGANVEWDADTRKVTIEDGGRVIIITLNSSQVLVDSQLQDIDSVPVMQPPGRIFMPLRFVSETMGSQVEYNAITRQIIISGSNG